MCSETSTIGLGTPIRVLERERREVLEERRSFERFGRRIRDLETGTGAVRSPAVGPTVHAPVASSSGIAAVREAYVETVMSVPHYSELYDETWLESVAGELNDELAAALGQHSILSPQLKQSLIAAAKRATINRDRLLESVGAELEALERSERELSALRAEHRSLLDQPIDRLEFNALRLTRARLLELGRRCDELAADRQEQLRRRQRDLTAADVGTLEGYFYRDCERSYPVLAEVAILGRRIDRAIRTVARAITTAA